MMQTQSRATDNEACLDWLHKNCFKEILAIERGIEDRKLVLARQPDFSLEQAFIQFSDTSLTRLSAQDLMYGFERLGITCSMDDARLLVARFDADEDMKLGFWEFSNMFLPVEPVTRDDLERRKSNGYAAGISSETRMLLQQTLRNVIDAENMVESMRQQVSKTIPINLRQVFDSLDWLKRGFLTSSEFRRYFEGYPDETTELRDQATKSGSKLSLEIEAMLRRFNKDKLNGRVSLPEFMDALTPKCPERQF